MAIYITDAALQQALDLTMLHGQSKAAVLIGLSRSGVQTRLRIAARRGLTPTVEAPTTGAQPLHTPPSHEAALAGRVKSLETRLKAADRVTLDAEYVKRQIVGLRDDLASAEPPDWLVSPKKVADTDPGTPTLFASDWHWGEVVDPRQINGTNDFNLEIAHRRAKALITTSVDLLKHHMVRPNYPGIVFVLGGDMMSGDIHEELEISNEVPMMPTVLDLWGVLVWCISTLADEFGRVFVPCVTGNHGRATKKPRMKGRNHTSFDWLLYQFLAKRFENDKRVSFLISDGPDAYYKVHNHRYLLTHGDQFRGGDGMIGALGPITRGDHKKRSRNMQVGMGYDTLLMGHWHQLILLRKLIVNGSLKGYDEYADANNFSYEPAQQALWITHPQYGITFQMPVFVDRKPARPVDVSWVSIPT